VVILAPIVERDGLAGLLTAGCLAGLLLIVMGVARLGRFVEFIPYPVTTGFTAGIATVIGLLQAKDVFGLRVDQLPEHFLPKLAAFWAARGSASATETCVAAFHAGAPRGRAADHAPDPGAIDRARRSRRGRAAARSRRRDHRLALSTRPSPATTSPGSRRCCRRERCPGAISTCRSISCARSCRRRSRSRCSAPSSRCCRPSSPTG
jgi:hypothetical protein